MVVATEQPICENQGHQNQQQDPALDRQLQLLTCALLAVPFYFAGELHGVISAVQLQAGIGSIRAPGVACLFHLRADREYGTHRGRR